MPGTTSSLPKAGVVRNWTVSPSASAFHCASAVSFSGGAIDSDITFESGPAGGILTNGEKRVWEALGLTADPHKEYDLALTLTAASDAAGTILVRYYYI